MAVVKVDLGEEEKEETYPRNKRGEKHTIYSN